ncbi:hypothetical protein [Streptomyces sp. NPDC087437]|uniref:hypothetical protein n=1 Tax=Streptomyces sp. NPDC087437 TaxID=3365789 RepID=UPI00380A0BB3
MSQHNMSLGAWSVASGECTSDELDELIDIEAGLTEILLQSRHDATIDDLDLLVDEDAGLGAILGRCPAPRPDGLADRTIGTLQQENIPSITAVQRLTLRGTPEFASALAVLRKAHSLSEHLSAELKGVIELELSLASLAGEILQRALPAEEKDESFPRAHPVERAIELLTVLNLSLKGVLSLVDRLVDYSVRNHVVTIESPDVAFSQLKTLRADLYALLDQIRLSDSPLNLEQLQVPHFYIRSIGPEVMRFIRSALPAASGFPMNDAALQDALGFFDDFTSADLRSADLAHADLEGIRWSLAATNWPTEMDRDQLVGRSREISWGSGIYVVESGAVLRNFAGQV